ncbi:MAG: S1 RNA-binding domain-containing protein [Clostridia bacterium]
MQVEVGAIFDGKITGITKFGAFVDFAEDKTGMVHISEVAPTFVKEIKDFLTMGQDVKVKVLSIAEDGKIALSIKRATETAKPRQEKFAPREKRQDRPPRNNFRRSEPVVSPGRPGEYEWQNKSQQGTGDFEDMLSKFKQSSDEKISNLKRNTDSRRSGHSSRRDK